MCLEAACTAFLSATSSKIASALPNACNCSKALALVEAFLPLITTCAPALTNSKAPAKPMPLPPPVTQATRPIKVLFIKTFPLFAFPKGHDAIGLF